MVRVLDAVAVTVMEPPRLTDDPLIVMALFVRPLFGMFVNVFDAPLIDLLVNVSIVARPTKVSVLVGRVKVPVLTIVLKLGDVRVGLVENTRFVEVVPVAPEAVYPVMLLKAAIPAADAPVPPLDTCKTPVTVVVRPIFPQEGATPTPPEIRAFPVATSANLDKAVVPDAYSRSPTL
jgi:hypothetical protein